MELAALAQPGLPKLPALSRRAIVLAAIAALHAVLLYFMVIASPGSAGRLDASVIEAEIIPLNRRIPEPPSSPPIEFQVTSPIDLTLLRVAINVPADPAPSTDAITLPDSVDEQPAAAGTAQPEVDLTPIVRPPRPISGPRGVDRYPTASLHAKETGTVVMKVCVSPTGKVEHAELTRSSGFPRLDRVALGIASEYRFKPALRDGQAVPACVLYSIVFKLV